MMPGKYTSYGQNISPDISWEGAPQETRSFALIMEDPDVPARAVRLFTFAHWVVYNIPPAVTSLPEALPREEALENGAKQGRNGWGRTGYDGPRPPWGTHRYYFKVYALDTTINLELPRATRKSVLKATEGHILAYGELMARYRRGGWPG